MTRMHTKAYAYFIALVVMFFSSFILTPVVVAGPLDLESINISTGEIVIDRPITVYRIKTLYISAKDELALVSYTQRTDNGPTLKKLGWIFLSNDRSINYKMGMITLIRDAMADPSRGVGIQIVSGTANASRRIISAVSIGPKTE